MVSLESDIVKFEGKIKVSKVSVLHSELKKIIDSLPSSVTILQIDLSAVKLCDLSFWQLLLSFRKALKLRDISTSLSSVSESCYENCFSLGFISKSSEEIFLTEMNNMIE